MNAMTRPRVLTLALLAAGLAGGAVAVALATAPPVAGAPTCSITWGGATSTDWDTASNWTPTRLPRATDVVCMAAAPTRLAVTSASTHTTRSIVFTNPGSSLTITGGTTTVTESAGSANAANLTRLVLQSGTWSGTLTAATLTLTNGTIAAGTVTATGTSTACSATLDAATLVNQGSLTYDTGADCYYLLLGNGSRLSTTATGTFTLVGDGTWGLLDNGGAANRVVNAGGLVVALAAATDTSVVAVPFANTGSVTAATGTVELSGGSAPGTPDTGSYAIGANAGVRWSGGTRTVTTIASTGAGPLTVSGGSAVFSAGSIARLALTGGSIGGTVSLGDLTATSGGTITGPGTVTTTGTSSVCGLTLDGGTLSNQGALTYDSSNACYYWLFQNAASFTNTAGGTFAVTGDGTWGLLDNGGAASRVVNAGSTTVGVTGDGVVEISVPTANTGAMTATTGQLRLTGGGVAAVPDTGSYSGTGTGSVDLAGGARTATTVSGPGPLTVSGGSTTFSAGSIGAVDLVGGTLGGTVSIGDLTTGSNGTIAGPGTVTTTGTSTVCGLSLDGSTLLNQGTLTFNTGNACYYWLLSNAARFTNAAGATLAVTGNGSWTALDNGGAASSVVNAGTATVTLTAPGNAITVSIPFTNNGSLTAVRGTVTLPAVTNLSGGQLSGGTWNAPTGTITLPTPVGTNAATVSIGATGQIKATSSGAAAFIPLAVNTGSFTIARNLNLTSPASLTNTGTLTVAAGTLVMRSLTQSGGTSTVAAGATLSAGTAAVRINGGTLTGSGTVGGAVSGGGTVAPGTSGAGTLSVTGPLTTTDGTTIAVTENAGSGTSVAASAAVNVGGAVVAITTTGAPAIGTVRTVISGSSRTGTVASVTGIDVPAAGGYWVLGYSRPRSPSPSPRTPRCR